MATPRSLGHRSNSTPCILWATIFQLTYLKGCPGTWLQGQVGPNSPSLHFEQRHAAYFARLGWSKAQRDSHNLRKKSTAVPILSPTFPLAAVNVHFGQIHKRTPAAAEAQ